MQFQNFWSLWLFILSFVIFTFFGCSPKLSDVIALNHNATLGATSDPINVTKASKQIQKLASASACAEHSFTGRGRAPAGYMKGISLAYARSLCRIKSQVPLPAASILGSANSHNAAKDVLAYFEDVLLAASVSAADGGAYPLRATYLIGIGLGMRESSGKYCEGWDVAAGSNRTSDEAEAGLFQVSRDSINASKELQRLYSEYKANPSRCMLESFKENVKCSSQSILGSGEGAEFQKFVKLCPAFAAEYAMSLVRLMRSHFGPINRKAAEVVPACDDMLEQVEAIVEKDPESICHELF